ncbi:MAG: BON domain-containing protein [Planctomycetia bacterium]|nr:BON domain-containing protein [Planctomycetia bacterium]
MRRLEMNDLTSIALLVACALCLTLSSARSSVAQTATDSDVAQSMGVGMQSRFASGATPISIERTSIIPGTPMAVNSTMSNIMTTNGRNGSFGGILARYDTSTFGKFFGTGQLTQRTPSTRIDDLDNLTQGDNEVENVEMERMYPPRLTLDFDAFPRRSLTSENARYAITSQVENVMARFNFDKSVETLQIESEGTTIILRGRVKTAREARLLANVVGMQAGVDQVINNLEILTPETDELDVFGRPLRTTPSSSGRPSALRSTR